MDDTNHEDASISRRGLLGAAGFGTMMLAGATSTAIGNQGTKKADQLNLKQAFIDGTGHGWRVLGPKDFAKVNSADSTWSWKDGVLYCTGKPLSVIRSAKIYTNFEIIFEWNHRKKAGNSGCLFGQRRLKSTR